MYMFLQGNRSHQLELSYYAISSHLNNQNSRKPVERAFLTHNDDVITRTNEVSRPKYFFNRHHLLDATKATLHYDTTTRSRILTNVELKPISLQHLQLHPHLQHQRFCTILGHTASCSDLLKSFTESMLTISSGKIMQVSLDGLRRPNLYRDWDNFLFKLLPFVVIVF